jgi:hypothetical protein
MLPFVHNSLCPLGSLGRHTSAPLRPPRHDRFGAIQAVAALTVTTRSLLPDSSAQT